MRTSIRVFLFGALFWAVSALGFAQVDLSSLSPSSDDQTIGEFKEALEATALGLGEIELQASEIVSAQPSAASTPAGFGSRVHNTLTNFLPLFDVGVNAIDTAEDEKSVTVSFNPVRLGIHGAVNLKATIVEPAPFKKLIDAIVEPARSGQKETLAKQLDDFADVEWSVTYGYQRSAQGKSWDTVGRLFGRNYTLYEDLVKELMQDVWDSSFSVRSTAGDLELADFHTELFVAFAESEDDTVNIDELSVGQVRSALGDRAGEYFDLLRGDALNFLALNESLKAARIDQIAAMIDNQPQLTFSGTYRSRDDLVGPDSYSGKLTWEIGSRNFNTARKEYRKAVAVWKAKKDKGLDAGPAPTALDGFLQVRGTGTDFRKKDKFSLTLTYQKRDKYSREYMYTESVTDPMMLDSPLKVDRVASVDQVSTEEFCFKGQWGRAVSRQKVMLDGKEVYPRIDVSLERVDAHNDPDRKDRWVAQATYLLPLPSGVALPLSLTYSDKSEFLGDPDKQLTAHLGFSYSLDRLTGKSADAKK